MAANLPGVYERSALYVDKILKGTKPADLPAEQPNKISGRDQHENGDQIARYRTLPPTWVREPSLASTR
ncbi:MAG: hypothetical protein WAN49_10605 [Pseudolabrys sp.]